MTTVLVVGASGFLGSAVTASFEGAGRQVVGTHHESRAASADVRYDFFAEDSARPIEAHDPDVVVFVAHVERTEHGRSSFDAAVDRFVETCDGRRLVYVSSDAVFDGEAGRYDESAPRSPTTTYGRRLVRFEDAVLERLSAAVVVRPSYVYGFAPTGLDSRLAGTRDSIRAGEPIAYYDDGYRSPIEVWTTARAIANLATSDATGVVHLAAPRTSIYAFHRHAATALGLDAGLVRAEPMPPDAEFARDRSLESGRLRSLTGIEPSPVAETLDAPASCR